MQAWRPPLYRLGNLDKFSNVPFPLARPPLPLADRQFTCTPPPAGSLRVAWEICRQMLVWVTHVAYHRVSRRQCLSSISMAPVWAATPYSQPRRTSRGSEARGGPPDGSSWGRRRSRAAGRRTEVLGAKSAFSSAKPPFTLVGGV